MLQLAVLQRGGCLSGVISVAGRAAAGRCCGGRVSAMGRILRRTREASLASAVQNEGRHCCAAERSRPECQPAALRSRRRESGAKGPLIGRLLQASCVARYTLLYPIQRKKGSSCKTYLMALLALRTKPKSRIPIRLMRFFAPNIKSRRKTTLRRLRFPRKKCRQSPNTIGAGRG